MAKFETHYYRGEQQADEVAFATGEMSIELIAAMANQAHARLHEIKGSHAIVVDLETGRTLAKVYLRHIDYLDVEIAKVILRHALDDLSPSPDQSE